MSTLRTLNIEADLPTLDEARRRAIDVIRQARREGVRVLTNEGVTLLLLR